MEAHKQECVEKIERESDVPLPARSSQRENRMRVKENCAE